MNYWLGRPVTLYLSEQGRDTFSEIFGGPSVEVSVEWTDELGLWIFREQVDEATTSVMLVKWSHLESATVDLILEEEKQPGVLGFRT